MIHREYRSNNKLNINKLYNNVDIYSNFDKLNLNNNLFGRDKKFFWYDINGDYYKQSSENCKFNYNVIINDKNITNINNPNKNKVLQLNNEEDLILFCNTYSNKSTKYIHTINDKNILFLSDILNDFGGIELNIKWKKQIKIINKYDDTNYSDINDVDNIDGENLNIEESENSKICNKLCWIGNTNGASGFLWRPKNIIDNLFLINRN